MIFGLLVALGLFLMFPRFVVGTVCFIAMGSAVIFLMGVVAFLGMVLWAGLH